MKQDGFERAVERHERERRAARNRELFESLGAFQTAEDFFRALHSLEGLNTREREAAKFAEFA